MSGLPEPYATALMRDLDNDEIQIARAALARCESDIAIANTTGDRTLLQITTARHTSVEALLAEYEGTHPALEAEEARYVEAARQLMTAIYVDAAGTTDAKKAMTNAAALTVAAAAERALRAALIPLRGAVSSPIRKVRALMANAESHARDAAVIDTRSYLGVLFSMHIQNEATARASRAGMAATNVVATWWPFAEAIVRAEFAKLQKADTRPSEGTYNEKEKWIAPTLNNLEACFEARRAGLESARRRAAQHVAELAAAR